MTIVESEQGNWPMKTVPLGDDVIGIPRAETNQTEELRIMSQGSPSSAFSRSVVAYRGQLPRSCHC